MYMDQYAVFRKDFNLRVWYIVNCTHGKTSPSALNRERTNPASPQEHPMCFKGRDRISWSAEPPDRADVFHYPEAGAGMEAGNGRGLGCNSTTRR
jgi:hypothetical protein